MRSLHLCWLGCVLFSLLVPGCASLKLSPAPLVEQVAELRDAPQDVAQLSAVAARHTQGNPLLVKETTLAGISLGASAEAVRTRWGQPRAVLEQDGVHCWSFKGHAEESGPVALRVRLKKAGTDPDEFKVTQVQVWWPSQHQTRTMVRPFDPAARILRKYGPPEQSLPWGSGQAWVYPAANVAFIVTGEPHSADPVVAGIVVGL